MNNIKLKSLNFGNTTIIFNDGVNYILGRNNSGKTVWFSILQYSLGLKKTFSYSLSLFKGEYSKLSLEIGAVSYEFTRDINSKEILIISSGIKNVFNVGSESYANYLAYLLEPKEFANVSSSYIISLMKESFISEDLSNRGTFPLRYDREAYTLLLGVNSVYPNIIKRYISELSSEIKYKEDIYSEIKLYKDDALFTFKRELPSGNALLKIEEVLDSTLLKNQGSINELYKVHNKSKELLENINIQNENLLNSISERLQVEFLHYLNNLSINEVDIDLKHPFTYRESGYSYSKRGILSIVAKLVIQSNAQLTNGVGLLINDSNIIYLHSHSLYEFRKLVRQVCETKSLQYIEFTSDYTSVNSAEVVFDLGKGDNYA